MGKYEDKKSKIIRTAHEWRGTLAIDQYKQTTIGKFNKQFFKLRLTLQNIGMLSGVLDTDLSPDEQINLSAYKQIALELLNKKRHFSLRQFFQIMGGQPSYTPEQKKINSEFPRARFIVQDESELNEIYNLWKNNLNKHNLIYTQEMMNGDFAAHSTTALLLDNDAHEINSNENIKMIDGLPVFSHEDYARNLSFSYKDNDNKLSSLSILVCKDYPEYNCIILSKNNDQLLQSENGIIDDVQLYFYNETTDDVQQLFTDINSTVVSNFLNNEQIFDLNGTLRYENVRRAHEKLENNFVINAECEFIVRCIDSTYNDLSNEFYRYKSEITGLAIEFEDTNNHASSYNKARLMQLHQKQLNDLNTLEKIASKATENSHLSDNEKIEIQKLVQQAKVYMHKKRGISLDAFFNMLQREINSEFKEDEVARGTVLGLHADCENFYRAFNTEQLDIYEQSMINPMLSKYISDFHMMQNYIIVSPDSYYHITFSFFDAEGVLCGLDIQLSKDPNNAEVSQYNSIILTRGNNTGIKNMQVYFYEYNNPTSIAQLLNDMNAPDARAYLADLIDENGLFALSAIESEHVKIDPDNDSTCELTYVDTHNIQIPLLENPHRSLDIDIKPEASSADITENLFEDIEHVVEEESTALQEARHELQPYFTEYQQAVENSLVQDDNPKNTPRLHAKKPKPEPTRAEYLRLAAMGLLVKGAAATAYVAAGALIVAGGALGAVFLSPVIAASSVPAVAAGATGLGMLAGALAVGAAVAVPALAVYGAYKGVGKLINHFSHRKGNKPEDKDDSPAAKTATEEKRLR